MFLLVFVFDGAEGFDNVQCKQERKWHIIIIPRGCDDGRSDKGTDECGCFPDLGMPKAHIERFKKMRTIHVVEVIGVYHRE
jgi:hypothetical protein